MDFTTRDQGLLDLLALLGDAGYRFTAVTPATHAGYLARQPGRQARDLRDIFGWSLDFTPATLPPPMLDALTRADAIAQTANGAKSRVRASSVGDRLFLHSAFPTTDENSVFFGPDTYRFIAFVLAELAADARPVRRIVEIGAGSGAAGLVAAAALPGARVTLADLNPSALRLAQVNARHAGIAAELVEGAGLDPVTGPADLILANPPYMMDGDERTYRDGGGMLGAQLSLDWALAAARRLEAGGRMLLYTGVAIAGGRDRLREALTQALPATGCTLAYRELDPDVFGEELEKPAYRKVERIAAVGAVITRT